MASFNADIHIGVTGKAKLNQLEAQLKRTQVQLNKLNKSLQLRTRVQAIRLDTRAANTAIKQLEQRINKLGRTINVNLRVNEKEGRRASGGASGSALPVSVAFTQQVQKQQKAMASLADTTVEVRGANNKLQQVNRRADKFYGDLNAKIAERNDLLKQQAKDIKDVTDVETSRNAKARTANQNRIFGNQLSKSGKSISPAQAQGFAEQRIQGAGRRIGRLNREIDVTRKKYENLTRVQRSFWNQENQRVRQATAGWERYNNRLKESAAIQAKRQKVTRGFGTGAGIAAATSLGSIPVLNEAVTGGLAAGLSGGSVAAGALGGAVVGLGAAFVATTADVTTFNNELLKQQRALANTVSTSSELQGALNGIERASQDFLIPIGEATQQFTKLNAAARASGFTVEEVEEVYRGLAAANTALGGDSQKLQGILLATQQVFSKGKVQAEELRGQIGERLPGAFALFAEAVGKTPAELDKALEKGEVTLQDFVTFSRSLLERYEDNAKKIADAPENAAQRLKVAMDGLKRAMGPILTDIGNFFLNLANTIVKQLTRMFDAINNARASQALAGQRTARSNLDEARRNLQTQQDAFNEADDKSTTGAAYKRLKNATEGYEMATRALRQANQNVANTKLPFDATGKPLKDKLDPPLSNNSSGGGSKSGPRDITAELTAELALEKELLRIEGQRFGLRGFSGQLRELELRDEELKAQLANEELQIATQNITEESKALAIQVARKRNARDILSLLNERSQLIEDQKQAFQTQLEGLQSQVAIEQAITEEKKNQLRFEAAIAEVDRNEGLTGDQKNQLKDQLKLLEDARKANQGVSGYVRQLQGELADTEGMIVSLAQTIESELASAMSTAVTGLIDGTTKVEDAMASMFENIGKAFIDMATQIIAKQLVMIALQSILKALGGATGSSYGSGAQAPLTGGIDYSSAFSGGAAGIDGLVFDPSTTIPTFSTGGYTGGGARSGGLDGQGGFLAMLHPQETVVDHTKGQDSLERYNPGSSAAMNMKPIDVQYNVTEINSMRFVTEEQMHASSREAARMGAKQGERQVYAGLRNSRSRRSKLGL